jgi:hypothetical protein
MGTEHPDYHTIFARVTAAPTVSRELTASSSPTL